MADLVIDYQLLHDAAGQLDSLKTQIDDINNADTIDGYVPIANNGQVDTGDLGPGNLPTSLWNFYSNWQSPLSNATKQVQQLAATFRGVAQTFFDADASQVAAVNSGLAQSAVRNYPSEYAAYQKQLAEWEKLPDPNHVQYYDENGNLVTTSVPRPTAPTNPGTTYGGSAGVTTNVTTSGTDGSGNPLVTSETSTYTVDGMTYTETTTFGPDKGDVNGHPTQDSTQTIHHQDGSTDVITTTNNLDGSSHSTDVNTASGQTTTTTTDTTVTNHPDGSSTTVSTTDNADGSTTTLTIETDKYGKATTTTTNTPAPPDPSTYDYYPTY
ncbi:hypothetical protein KGA66_00715 [Actinocrinis puniceicyclus]|uniref:Uncharacterized protein n=1 Tax=Actinocrinis puniceicyclus TaxID=977794 RepID=A0A8J7WKS5_9ACTN|nr:hypothetical protein [Actinocrinis puniceicyclus]MBS2961547.1 hypothetical protein [Actinocrinis puniceicyclus]